MARGLKLPAGVNKRGGAALVEGDEEAMQIIKTALGDCSSEHAYQQDIGLGEDMVFDIGDPVFRGRVLRRLNQIFRQFEALDRFKLMTHTIKWTENPAEQEQILEFKYLDLETDVEETFKYTPGS